jgi:hypothetical protein
MKVSSLMISIVLCGIIVFAFTSYMGSIYHVYSPSNYDNDFFNQVNTSYDQTYILANQTRTDLQTLTSDTSILQKIDAFFSAGFSSFKMVFSSVNTFSDMTVSAGKVMGIDDRIWMGLILIVIISLFVGVFLSTIMKREL